jgi:hypothetical protein
VLIKIIHSKDSVSIHVNISTSVGVDITESIILYATHCIDFDQSAGSAAAEQPSLIQQLGDHRRDRSEGYDDVRRCAAGVYYC